jgi:tetratricopeptide (TPR) repeat protein
VAGETGNRRGGPRRDVADPQSRHARRPVSATKAAVVALFSSHPKLRKLPMTGLPTADDHVRNGREFARKGEFSKALEEFGAAIKLDPKNFDAYEVSAEIYEHQGDVETALRGYTLAIGCDPASMLAFERRARLHERLKRNSEAAVDFGALIAGEPHDPRWHAARAFALLELRKDLPVAIADLTNAIARGTHLKDRAVYYTARGQCHGIAESTELAIQDFSAAIELNDAYAKAFDFRGLGYTKLDRNDLALADYSRAIELSPTNAEYLSSRGRIYQISGDHPKALADFDRACALVRPSIEMLVNRALSLEQVHEYQRARNDLVEAEKRSPNEAEVHAVRALVEFRAGSFKAAIVAANRAIELKPKTAKSYTIRGAAKRELGHGDDPFDDFRQAIILDAVDGEAFVQRALTYLKQEAWSPAVEDAEIALRLIPHEPRAQQVLQLARPRLVQ